MDGGSIFSTVWLNRSELGAEIRMRGKKIAPLTSSFRISLLADGGDEGPLERDAIEKMSSGAWVQA